MQIQPLHLIFLSIIQAATEFLPVSSSGHLLFLKGIFHEEDIPIIFDITIHVASLMAILIFYRKKIMMTFSRAWSERSAQRWERPNLRFLAYAVLSTIVTFAFYITLKDPIESMYRSPRILVFTYLATTILLFMTRFSPKRHAAVTQKSIWTAFVVGLVQGMAIMPGISRSGSTIAVQLIMGVRKEDAAYYSFFLAIPAILGALFFQLLELASIQFLKDHRAIVIVAFILCMALSYAFLVILVWVIRRGKLWMFSMYTLAMAALAWFLFG